jgi:hypothetical protein
MEKSSIPTANAAHGHEEDRKNLRSLTFIVNGKSTIVEKVNIHQPLHVAAEKALEQTGNTARPLADWLVKYNGGDLNLNAKVEDLNLPEDAKIFMSLKTAEGGN